MSYELRPSKAVTRRLFVDVLRRLSAVAAPSDYQYVGFGALEFADFELVHRQLGIAKMTSIEGDAAHVERYIWNRPYGGIEVLAGRASTILPSLDWSQLSIVWLDYTSTQTAEVLADIDTVASRLLPGSVLAVTLNAHPQKLGERVAALESAVGADRVPLEASEARLGQWGLADVQWEILNAELRRTLSERADSAVWRQVLNIHYQDAARMQIVAGVVSNPATERLIDQCRFSDLDFVRAGSDALRLKVPLLTLPERSWLNRQLPVAAGAALDPSPGVSEADVAAYLDIYRYLEALP
ncbi:O-methyltransferase [Geodermatophilus sp. DSM 45219]|uniref:O-methyltransferase n=1 Tax=Geodermatophilus sp. DSM 45219 TaxID=1881103 RepID=UPI00350F1911